MSRFKQINRLYSHEINIACICSTIVLLLSLICPIYYLDFLKNITSQNNCNISNLDILSSLYNSGIISKFNLMSIIIPIFAALILYFIYHNDTIVKTIRYKNRTVAWKSNAIIILITSFILSLFLVLGGYLASGGILGTFKNFWDTEYGIPYYFLSNSPHTPEEVYNFISVLNVFKVLIIIFITLFISLLFLGMLLYTLSVYIQKKYIYIAVIGEMLLEFIGTINIRILLTPCLSPLSFMHIKNIMIKNIILILAGFLIYKLGEYLYIRKDQYIGIYDF